MIPIPRSAKPWLPWCSAQKLPATNLFQPFFPFPSLVVKQINPPKKAISDGTSSSITFGLSSPYRSSFTVFSYIHHLYPHSSAAHPDLQQLAYVTSCCAEK